VRAGAYDGAEWTWELQVEAPDAIGVSRFSRRGSVIISRTRDTPNRVGSKKGGTVEGKTFCPFRAEGFYIFTGNKEITYVNTMVVVEPLRGCMILGHYSVN
jgi:hypothetical protein